MFLHAVKEFHNDFRAWTDEHLALARFLGVVDSIERIVKNACFDHVGGCEILNSMIGGEVSVSRVKDPC